MFKDKWPVWPVAGPLLWTHAISTNTKNKKQQATFKLICVFLNSQLTLWKLEDSIRIYDRYIDRYSR